MAGNAIVRRMKTAVQRPCLMTANQLARAIGLSRPTVLRLCTADEIRSQVLPGLGLRIRLEDALAYVRRARLVCKPLERMAAERGLTTSWLPAVHFISNNPDVISLVAQAGVGLTLLFSAGPFHAGLTLSADRPDAVIVDGQQRVADVQQILDHVTRCRPRPLLGFVESECGSYSPPEAQIRWRHPTSWRQVAADVVERLRRGAT